MLYAKAILAICLVGLICLAVTGCAVNVVVAPYATVSGNDTVADSSQRATVLPELCAP